MTSWWTGEQAIHNSQWSVRCARRARLRPSLAYWAYFALLRSSIRNSRLATLPLASLLCSLDFRFACFAHCARRSSVPLGARFVRPPPLPPPQPVSAEILRISGRGNCRETIFALENGIFRRGVLRAPAPLNSAWSSHTFAPPCANACAVFRPCGLRFAPCPRGSSRFAASDARRARLRHSLLHWAYFGLFPPLAAAFVRPRRTRRRGRLKRERALPLSLAF